MRERHADRRPRMLENGDIDSMSTQVLGCRAETIQLGRGPIHGSSVVVPLGEARVGLVHVRRATLLRGVSPRSEFSLLSSSPTSPALRVRSHPVGGRVCLMLGSQAPLEIYMPEDCGTFVLSARRASVIAGTPSDSIAAIPSRGRAELRALGTSQTTLLVKCMDLIESLRRASASEVVASLVQHRLRELLWPAAAGLFSQSQALPVGSEDEVMRRIAAVRACTHIDEHLREPIKLEDLCRVAGVRARTLEYGFQELYDIGPMAYLRSVRLCRARRDLLNPRRLDASVAKIARQWTFSHMGQFSRDYRALFGESPSTTLERARRSAAQPTHAPGPPSV